MITIYEENYEIDLTDNVFEKMLEYCKWAYGWNKDTLMDKISKSNVHIREESHERKIKNSGLTFIETRYYLVEDIFLGWEIHHTDIICPVIADPQTGIIGTAKEVIT